MLLCETLCAFGAVWLQGQAVPPLPAAPPALPAVGRGEEIDGAEVDIVDGNVVGAKKRALEEAFLRAVERVFQAELEDAGFSAAGALPDELVRLRGGFATGARRYVRSYRVVEDLEAGGKLKVAVAAVVDRAFLRRQIEKARAATPAVTGPASAVQVMSPEGNPQLVPALTKALRAGGLVAEAVEAGATGRPETVRVLLRGHAKVEGEVRGAGLMAARCQVDLAVRRPGGSRDLVLPSAIEWGFGPEAPVAEQACLDRLAPLAAKVVVPAVNELSLGTVLKSVTVTLDLVEPLALERFVRRLRRVGTVSRYELRRIALGAADVRVETNLPPDVLAKALTQAMEDELTLTAEPAVGDRIRMTLRVRADAAPAFPEDEGLEASP